MEQVTTNDADFARQIIDHLELDALETVAAHAQSQLEQVREQTRQEELRVLNVLAAKHGAALTWPKEKAKRGTSERRRNVSLPARFIDPANPDNRWSGRGRQPVWLQNYVAQGRSPSEFMTS